VTMPFFACLEPFRPEKRVQVKRRTIATPSDDPFLALSAPQKA
jgi:hypothetical protein